MKLEDAVELVLRIASKLRSEGVPIGTSEIIDALRVAENLALLENRELSVEDVHDAIMAVFAHDARLEQLVEKAWREATGSKQSFSKVLSAVEDDLRKLGVSWGARLPSKRRLLSGPHAEEKREAYSRLRLLGLIVRTPRGDMVLDRETALRRLRNILRRYSSPWEALAESAARMISRGRFEWFALYAAPVDEGKLAGVEIDRIAAAGLQALQEGNRGLARKLAAIVAKRLEGGEAPRDSWSAYRLLRELNELTPRSLASLLRTEPRLVEQLLKSREDRDLLAESLRLLDPLSLRSILRRLVRDKRGLSIAAGLVGEVDLSAWSEVRFTRMPRCWEEALVSIVSSLARAEQYLLAAIGGDEANLDMALDELRRAEKIDTSMLPGWAHATIEAYRERVKRLEALVAGDVDIAVKLSSIIRTMDASDALLYLKSVYEKGDEKLKRLALRLAEMLWRRLEARVSKGVAKGSRRRDVRGRIDVRKTIYNIIANRENPIVAYRKRRKPTFALVLDTSGSMAKYTIWALLSASAFARLLDSLTLFSSDVTVVRDAWRLSRRRIIEILFQARFEGYTNISAALRATSRCHNQPGRMLVVTDLCQTVEDEAPEAVTERLVRLGWRLYYILPPRHCTSVRERVAEHAVTRIVAKPEQIPRILSRLLQHD